MAVAFYNLFDVLSLESEIEMPLLEEFSCKHGAATGDKAAYHLSVRGMSLPKDREYSLRKMSERFYAGEDGIELDILKGYRTWRIRVEGFGDSTMKVVYSYPPGHTQTMRQRDVQRHIVEPLVRYLLSRKGILCLHAAPPEFCASKRLYVAAVGDDLSVLRSTIDPELYLRSLRSVEQVLAREQLICLSSDDIDEAPFRFIIQHDQVFGTNLWEEMWQVYRSTLKLALN